MKNYYHPEKPGAHLSALYSRESAATQTDINENSSTGRDGDENKHMPGDWGSCGKVVLFLTSL